MSKAEAGGERYAAKVPRMSHRTRSSLLRGLARAVLLVVSLGVPLALGELVLRVLPEPNSYVERRGRMKPRFNTYVSNGIFGYSLRPNWASVHSETDFEVTVRTNALGFRGPPASLVKAAGTYRIMVLGDSFAFGFGVEDDETLPAQLQARLQTGHENLEVLNAAVPGWSTDQHYLLLRTRLDELDPDLVLIALYQNDPDDLRHHQLTLDDERLPVRIRSVRRMIDPFGNMRYVNPAGLRLPSLSFPGQSWLQDHSEIYHWLGFRITRAWATLALRIDASRRESIPGDGPPQAIASLSPNEIQHALQTSKGFALRYHRFLIDEIEKLCRDRGVDLRFIQLVGKGQPELGTIGDILRSDCRVRPNCLDMELFFPEDELPTLFFDVDGHWNAAGHRRAASAVADWLAGDTTLPP